MSPVQGGTGGRGMGRSHAILPLGGAEGVRPILSFPYRLDSKEGGH